MEAELVNIITEFKNNDWNELLRKDLGKYSLEEAKSSFDHIKNVFDAIINYPDLAKLPIQYQNALQNNLIDFQNFTKEVKNQFSNTSEQEAWINRVRDKERGVWENLSNIIDFIVFVDPAKSSELEKYIQDAQEKINELDLQLETTAELLKGAQEKAISAEVGTYGVAFNNEANRNKESYEKNRVAMFGTAGVIVIVAFVLLGNEELANLKSFHIGDILTYFNNASLVLKLVFLSIGGYLVSHFARTYSAERHLYTINKHRQNALDSHQQIIKSVRPTDSENDKEITNAIVLELTKAIFENGDTGYLKGSGDSSSPTQVIDVSRYISK